MRGDRCRVHGSGRIAFRKMGIWRGLNILEHLEPRPPGPAPSAGGMAPAPPEALRRGDATADANNDRARDVAACRETGEPFPVETLGGNHQERWRHYAVQCSVHVMFPSCAPSAPARMIGAGSFVKPGYFYRSSLWHVLGQTPHARRGPVPWWSDEALDRVMRAIPHGGTGAPGAGSGGG